MRSSFTTLLFILFAGFFMVQCGDPNKPRDLIPQDKYENLLVEFQLLKIYQSTYEDSAKTEELRRKILDHYNVTIDQFKRSNKYYEINHKKEHQRLKTALDHLNEERDRLWDLKKQHESKSSKKGKTKTDSINQKDKKREHH
jgi:hypothetical protein